MSLMLRDSNPPGEVITIGTTVEASTPIDMSRFGGGSFHLPADSGTTEITVYAQIGNVAYGIANDEEWQPLAPRDVLAGLPYPFPSVSYNYQRIKLVASGGVETQNVPVFTKG